MRVTAAVACVLVAVCAALVARWPHAWLWVVTTFVVITAITSNQLPKISDVLATRAQSSRIARGSLQGTSGHRDAALPTVEGNELEVRVHRAVIEIPYIRRDKEKAVQDLLIAGRPVLVVGSSMVGKTKMTTAVVRDLFPGKRLVVPDSVGVLAALDNADISIRDAVVWLDDIDRLIGPGGVTDGALRRIAANNVVIATIRSGEYDRYQPTAQLRTPAWDVISVFEKVFIERSLTVRERERLSDAIVEPEVRSRIERVGLGEYVGAADRISDALLVGPSVSPIGYALVLGAADWRRSGMRRPIPVPLLRDLAMAHLDDRGRMDITDPQVFDTGLTWAKRDINPTVALLSQVTPDSFEIFDYALDLISSLGQPIPDATWRLLIDNASPNEALTLAFAAAVGPGHQHVMTEAFRKAMTSDVASVAADGALGLGLTLMQLGNLEEAMDAMRRALASGLPEAAPPAAAMLGMMALRRGDMNESASFFEEAMVSDHPAAGPLGILGGLMVMMENDDENGANRLLERMSSSNDPAKAALAKAMTVLVMAGRRQVDETKRGVSEVLESGEFDADSITAYMFGAALLHIGDIEGARGVWNEMLTSTDSFIAQLAASSLEVLAAEGSADVEALFRGVFTSISRIHTGEFGSAGLGVVPDWIMGGWDEIGGPSNDESVQ